MSKPTRTGLPPRKNFFASFLLSIILIGSVISSAMLIGLSVSPQQAWASHLLPPTLTDPPNTTITNDATPDFNWNSVSGAASYSLQVDNNNDFSSLTYTATPTSSSQDSGGPFTDGTYYWRVATKGSGTDAIGTYSSAFTFTVDTVVPTAPALLTPINAAFTNDPTPFFD